MVIYNLIFLINDYSDLTIILKSFLYFTIFLNIIQIGKV